MSENGPARREIREQIQSERRKKERNKRYCREKERVIGKKNE
jgi:hypothetical protein